MNQDRIAGTARTIAGKAEGVVGEVAGDEKLKAEGSLDQVKGKAQDLYGQAKDVAGSVIDKASDLADTTLERGREQFPAAERYYQDGASVVRKEVSDSPILAIIMAAVVGYLVGLVLHGRSGPDRDERGRYKG